MPSAGFSRYRLLMLMRDCPNCHGRVSYANRTPYCAKCGWNRDSALSSAQMSMNSLPIGILMFGGFIAFMIFGWHFRNPAQIAIFAIVPTVGILVNYISTKRTIRRLKAMPSSLAAAPTSTAASVTAASNAASTISDASRAENEALLHTPRPRPIRMAKRGKINIAVGVFAALVFAAIPGAYLYKAWSRSLSLSAFAGKDWLMVGIMCLLLLIPYGIWRSQVKECALLQKGEIAIGRITRQSTSNQNSSSVFYDFTDIRGQTHSSAGIDYTQKLFDGMTVPVFYDTDNPKRNVAYCATLHEVVSQ